MKQYENLFSVEDVAMRLKCTRYNVYALIRNGKLRAYNIGRGEKPRYVIFEKDYVAYKATRVRQSQLSVREFAEIQQTLFLFGKEGL